MASDATILAKRDEKVRSHLKQYAPVWIVDEVIKENEDESVQFNVVFLHHLYGWVNRRYLYDSFNNTLYHKGQTTVSEEYAVDLQEQEPYINVTVSDIPNAYGG
jgi:hypothetical protein